MAAFVSLHAGHACVCLLVAPQARCKHVGDCMAWAVPRRLGHPTRHFNVGQYRRKQKGEADVQDAAFFDHNNPARPHTLRGSVVQQGITW